MTPQYCNNCGSQIQSGGKFCKNCGNKIEKISENPTISSSKKTKKSQSKILTIFLTLFILLIITYLGYILFKQNFKKHDDVVFNYDSSSQENNDSKNKNDSKESTGSGDDYTGGDTNTGEDVATIIDSTLSGDTSEDINSDEENIAETNSDFKYEDEYLTSNGYKLNNLGDIKEYYKVIASGKDIAYDTVYINSKDNNILHFDVKNPLYDGDKTTIINIKYPTTKTIEVNCHKGLIVDDSKLNDCAGASFFVQPIFKVSGAGRVNVQNDFRIKLYNKELGISTFIN